MHAKQLPTTNGNLSSDSAIAANEQDRLWLYFLSFCSWLVLLLILVHQVPLKILAQNEKQGSQAADQTREIRVLVENPPDKTEKEKKHPVFLSDKDQKAQGSLTRKQGFESATTDHKLNFSRKNQSESDGEEDNFMRKLSRILTTEDSNLTVHILKETKRKKAMFSGDFPFGNEAQTRIPSNYRFRDEFALSWSAQGEPRIPARKFEHYRYFRQMLDKIQQNWAPPGGQPYPTFGDDYHRMNYAPGYSKYSSYPSQDVRVIFMLDNNGEVIDVKLHSSLGYKILDQSCIEAIVRSRNFGPPPKEMIEQGGAIFPLIFRIIVR